MAKDQHKTYPINTLQYMYPLYLLERKENLTISREREKRLRENTGLI